VNLKFEVILGEYRHHTRDQIFKLESIRRDITFFAGDTNILKVKIRHKDHLNSTYNKDITGWEFILKIKENPDDVTSVLERDVTNLSDPISGEADIDVTFHSGEDLLGSYLYQLESIDNENKKNLLGEGIISFKQTF
jgi:hypothetical protein